MLPTSCTSPKRDSWFDCTSCCAAWNSIFLLSGVAEFNSANAIWISGGICNMDACFLHAQPWDASYLCSSDVRTFHVHCSFEKQPCITSKYRSLTLFWQSISYLCLCLPSFLRCYGQNQMDHVPCTWSWSWSVSKHICGSIINCNPGMWQELRLDTSTLVWLLDWLVHYTQWSGFDKTTFNF